MKSEKEKSPSPTDLMLLSVLWKKKDGSSCKVVRNELIDKKIIQPTIAYTTIKTYLDRLVHKGFASVKVDTDDPKKSFKYSAKIARADLQKSDTVINKLLNTLNLLGLNLTDIGIHFVNSSQYTKKDIIRQSNKLKSALNKKP